jgi:PEP-CTERM motif
MQRRTLPISALAAMLATGAANAVPIHYFFHGTGEWTLNGIEAGGDFTAGLTGDTAGIVFQGDQSVNRVSGTFSSGGSAVAFTDNGPVDFNEVLDGTAAPGTLIFAQVFSGPPPAAWALTNTVFETYDLSHALSLTSGVPFVTDQPFSTSGGALEFSSISALSFQATVPEPSTWVMMAMGLAVLGFAGHKRAKTGHATFVP